MDKNPWLTIWTQPRTTIGRIVAENPNRSLWLLAAIYGFCSLMNLFQSAMLGSVMGSLGVLLFAMILSPFWGYLSFTIWSWFVLWVGKLFKGQAPFKNVRSAYAWSCVPIAFNIPLWFLMAFLFGNQLFLNFPNAHLLKDSEVFLLFILLTGKVVLTIWSLVIYLNALAEVQKYSVLRAILNVVAAGVLLSVVLFIFWSLLIYVLGGSTQPSPTAYLFDGGIYQSLRRGL